MRDDRQQPPSETDTAPPSLPTLLGVWLGLGVQSFGGGTATQYLIYRACVERRGWLSTEEFTRTFAICQLAPGINLLALTVLIGWRVRGAPGIALCLVGLLLPSAAITVLLTALYADVRDLPLVRSAIRGVVPATVGLGLLTAWQIARPLLASGGEGARRRTFGLAVMVASGLLVALGGMPVFAVLFLAGAVGAVVATRDARAGEEVE